MESDAETLWVRSTHEYFETCEYELLTPSELGDRAHSIFSSGKKKYFFFPNLSTVGEPSLKRVYTDQRIVFEQELDRRTFETVSVQYVINENIFRIFVTFFFINFSKNCEVKSQWSQS